MKNIKIEFNDNGEVKYKVLKKVYDYYLKRVYFTLSCGSGTRADLIEGQNQIIEFLKTKGVSPISFQ